MLSSQLSRRTRAETVAVQAIAQCTVERGALKKLAKFALYSEVSFYRGFFFMYLTITGVKRIVRYTEDFTCRGSLYRGSTVINIMHMAVVNL